MKPACRRTRPARPVPTGFSLVELLVALVVVSLGLGGILYSQARGIQTLNAGGWRAQAAVLAEHIIERARANPEVSYTVAFGTTPSGSTVSEVDLRSWKTQLSRNLPQGDGRIVTTATVDAASGDTFEMIDVTVRWDDQRAGSSDVVGADLRHLRIQAYRLAP